MLRTLNLQIDQNLGLMDRNWNDMSWDETFEKFGDDSMMKELISCEGLEDDYNQSYQFCNFRRKQSCYQLKI
jgi:hypothetical protein